MKFGLTEKKAEQLTSSGKFDGTVRGLRDWIARDEGWHRQIKGFGPMWADKVSDALNAYYQANPLPENPETADAEPESVSHKSGSGSPTSHKPANDTDDVSATYSREELEMAFAGGVDAAMEERSVGSNPHPRGTALWSEWDRGWQETNNTPME